MNNAIEGSIMTEEDVQNVNDYDRIPLEDTGYTDMFSGTMGDILDEVLAGDIYIQYRGL